MAAIAIQDMGECGDMVVRRQAFAHITELTEKNIAKMICELRHGAYKYDEEDILDVMSSFGEDGNPPISFSDDKLSATWLDHSSDVHYTFVLYLRK